MIEIVSWGLSGSLVDLGHRGRSWLGAPRGGAVDIAALSLANRLVGNPSDAVGVESSGGLALRILEPAMVAVAGAVTHCVVDDGPPLGWGSPVVLPSGATVRLGRPLVGMRTYVAVRGGLFGSTTQLGVGPDPRTPAATEPAPLWTPSDTIAIWPGPRLDHFELDTWHRLLSFGFEVTDTSRVGVRLRGPGLRSTGSASLPSEGVLEGAVQVPPDGRPIVMLADHPTTGGYPVVAVVNPDDIATVAQAAPGDHLRFRSAVPPG